MALSDKFVTARLFISSNEYVQHIHGYLGQRHQCLTSTEHLIPRVQAELCQFERAICLLQKH